MKIDLRKLYGLKKIIIDELVSIPEETYQKMNVLRMENTKANGLISVNYDNNIELDLNINGSFIMPCEITGEEVNIPFETHIEQEILENSLKDDFYLDLSDILWENIVLEIPFKVIKEGAEIKAVEGEGWKLSNEE